MCQSQMCPAPMISLQARPHVQVSPDWFGAVCFPYHRGFSGSAWRNVVPLVSVCFQSKRHPIYHVRQWLPLTAASECCLRSGGAMGWLVADLEVPLKRFVAAQHVVSLIRGCTWDILVREGTIVCVTYFRKQHVLDLLWVTLYSRVNYLSLADIQPYPLPVPLLGVLLFCPTFQRRLTQVQLPAQAFSYDR